MSVRFERNQHLLQKLKNEKSQINRKNILRSASRDFIICLVECISSILEKKVPLTSTQRKKLSKHAAILRQISKVRSEDKARKLLIQKGGAILPLLIPPLLSVAASLFGNLLSGQ
jgi:hypothetical protein